MFWSSEAKVSAIISPVSTRRSSCLDVPRPSGCVVSAARPAAGGASVAWDMRGESPGSGAAAAWLTGV